MLSDTSIADMLQMTRQGVGKWRKQERAIISFFDQYFSKEDISEFLTTNEIEKLKLMKNISIDQLRQLSINQDESNLFLDYLKCNINLKKVGSFNSNITAYLPFFQKINQELNSLITPENAKKKIIKYILDEPTSVLSIFSSIKLNPLNQKQLIKDLDTYYSSAEIYVLITENIKLKR